MTDTLMEKLEIMKVGDEEMKENIMQELEEKFDIQQMEKQMEQDLKEALAEEGIEKLEPVSEEQLKQMEQEIVEEQKSLRDEIIKMNEEIQKDLQEMNKTFDRNKIKEDLVSLVEEYGNDPKHAHELLHVKKFLTELEACSDFNPLLKSVSKIKNPSKIINRFEEDFDNMLSKLLKKFNSNAHYRFINPIKAGILEKTVELLGNEKDAKLFVYVFAGFASNQNTINNNAIFINEVLRQLKYISSINKEDRELLKSNILKVLDLIK